VNKRFQLKSWDIKPPSGTGAPDEVQHLNITILLSERALGRSYFRADTVRGMWDRHQRGERNHAHHLWALMVLELWHRLFIDESGPTDVAPNLRGAGR